MHIVANATNDVVILQMNIENVQFLMLHKDFFLHRKTHLISSYVTQCTIDV